MTEPLIVYWSSNSGHTKALANKLEAKTLNTAQAEGLRGQPFIILTPTYDQPQGGHIPPQVEHWLRSQLGMYPGTCVGVIGTGNRNFGQHYCQAAQDIANHYDIPILYRCELRGTQADVNNINEGIRTQWDNLTTRAQQ